MVNPLALAVTAALCQSARTVGRLPIVQHVGEVGIGIIVGTAYCLGPIAAYAISHTHDPRAAVTLRRYPSDSPVPILVNTGFRATANLSLLDRTSRGDRTDRAIAFSLLCPAVSGHVGAHPKAPATNMHRKLGEFKGTGYISGQLNTIKDKIDA